MWLAFYNPLGVGDVLLLTSGSVPATQIRAERQNNVVALKLKATDEIVGYNLFEVAPLQLKGQGNVQLDSVQLAQVNQWIAAAGFNPPVSASNEASFVVGYVEQCQPHPDSDHLSITQTRISETEQLQIVCGASNIAQGQHVIVAKPGAVMPSGLVIWPGELRGEASHGMICSTRELGLESIENKPGIWVVANHFTPGTPLADVVAYYQA